MGQETWSSHEELTDKTGLGSMLKCMAGERQTDRSQKSKWEGSVWINLGEGLFMMRVRGS